MNNCDNSVLKKSTIIYNSTRSVVYKSNNSDIEIFNDKNNSTPISIKLLNEIKREKNYAQQKKK